MREQMRIMLCWYAVLSQMECHSRKDGDSEKADKIEKAKKQVLEALKRKAGLK